MSISVSRQKNQELKADTGMGMRVVFRLQTKANMPEDLAIEKLQEVAAFLVNFSDKRIPAEKSKGLIASLEFENILEAGKVLSLNDFKEVNVCVGFAQEFQDKFNAEFSAHEL